MVIYCRSGQCFLFVCLTALAGTASSRWWYTGSERVSEAVSLSVCNQKALLTAKQSKLCRRYPDYIKYVSDGLVGGITECQSQFRNHRWNCSTFQESPFFGKVIDQDIRETAFVQAITSAGVVFSISRACENNLLRECDVRRETLQYDWERDGTHFKGLMTYAAKFAKDFIDTRERNSSVATRKMQHHNNHIGRMAVEEVARLRCKCHGLKSSCALKTCWKSLGDFKKAGNLLKKKYDYAFKVRWKKGRFVEKSGGDISKNLVFLNNSPNFCVKNENLAILGTVGRECDPMSANINGCDLMCCMRGYKINPTKTTEACNCKFKWCCYVACEKCERDNALAQCL